MPRIGLGGGAVSPGEPSVKLTYDGTRCGVVGDGSLLLVSRGRLLLRSYPPATAAALISSAFTFVHCVGLRVCVCESGSVRYAGLRLLLALRHRTRSAPHDLAGERSGARRQEERLFIDHFWPTWQQEGDEDKERNYGGQGGTKKKIGHPTRAKSVGHRGLKLSIGTLFARRL